MNSGIACLLDDPVGLEFGGAVALGLPALGTGRYGLQSSAE
jgi:hypothetical protein